MTTVHPKPRYENCADRESKDSRTEAIDSESIYFAPGVEGTCEGKDCSKYKLKPFANQRLISIAPAPPAANLRRVTLQANLELRNRLAGAINTVARLSRAGDFLGVILMMLLRGFGGDDVCKLYSKKCECRPNMQNPFEIWTSPPFTVPVEFQFGGAQYTANFEFKAQVDIVNGRCEDNEGPF